MVRIETRSKHLYAEIEGAVARIIFDNPAKHNIVNFETWQALPPLFEELATNPNIRLVTLTGAGDKAFIAGADISQFDDAFGAQAQDYHYDDATEAGFAAIRACSLPTLAAIKGLCIGGGLGVALACDMRLARDDAQFSIPAGKLGIAYPINATHMLVDIVGMAKAKEIFYTAKTYNAAEALDMGLVNEVTDRDNFSQQLAALEAVICGLAPLSLQTAKYAIDQGRMGDVEGMRERAAACIKSEDFIEGRRAYAEKRPPQFQAK